MYGELKYGERRRAMRNEAEAGKEGEKA